MISTFVKRPVTVMVGVLLVALFGTIGLLTMPMQLTPETQIPTIKVETRWPGASPAEVEQQIVYEQEKQLKSVEGVTKLSSESMEGMGVVEMEFPVGTDMREALLRVNTRLAQVPRYPPDAREPIISTTGASTRPIAWFILRAKAPTPEEIAAFQEKHPELREVLEPARRALNSGLRVNRLRDVAQQHPEVKELLPPDLNVPTYRKFAEDNIEARFERVEGVANSNVLGGREEELHVVVDPEKLAARKLTIADVRHALQGENADTSAGDFWEGKRRYVVRTLGQFRDPQQVSDTMITNEGGKPVYVRDVAEVRLGHKKPDGLVKQFGETCIAVNCERAVGANVLDVMKLLRVANRELNEGILAPRGLQLEQVYDETEYIYSSINLVQDNILIGGFLTVAVLLLFLRSGRATVVIAVAIPTSIVGTFLVMSLLDRSLNVVSLAGLAFAVGMLVDNAVVVLENIYQHYERGKTRFRACVDGASEVWGAVLSSSLTTVAVFLPILFIKEEAGQLFRDIALAISAGVMLSLLVSLSVIPMAAARLLKAADPHAIPGHEGAKRGRIERLFAPILVPIDAFAHLFVRFVMGLNRYLQNHPVQRLAVVVGFVGAAMYGSYSLMPRVEYLPNGNQNLVFGILLPPPGYNLDQLAEMGERIEKRMRPYWDIDPDDPRAAELPYPVLKDFFYVARGRSLFMGLKAHKGLEAARLVPLVREVSGAEPGTFGVGVQSSLFEQGLTAGRVIDVEIVGPDLAKLVDTGRKVFGMAMQEVPGAGMIPKPSLDLANPEVHVELKREQAAQQGVNRVELGYAVNALVDGAYVGDFFKGGEKIDLTIVGDPKFAQRSQDLDQLPIATPTGDLVPLSSVATVTIRSGPEQINHRQRVRAITVQVKVPPEMPLEDAMTKIQNNVVAPLQASGELGPDYQINLAGTADKLRSTWSALQFNVLLAVLITYLLMAALFESWLYPFVVILSVPVGAFGGFLGLYLLNQFMLQPLDVLTMLGFVILIGTVVNNPILIVEQALILIRSGVPHRQAVLEATRSRIRPIFMTTMTTVLGLVPLVVIPGAGSELYRGLGAVFLGGMMVSAVVTLFIVPSVFTLTLEGRALVFRVLGLNASQKPIDWEEPAPMEVVPSRNGEAVHVNGTNGHAVKSVSETVPDM